MKISYLSVFLLGLSVTQIGFADFKEYFYQKYLERQASSTPQLLHGFLTRLPQAPTTIEGKFTQILNPEDQNDARTFEQRYFVNSDYATGPGAPVIFYICGEAACSAAELNANTQNLAKIFGAYRVALEHRYYGQSQPFTTLTTDNLQYLKTQFALEDLSRFQKFAQSSLGLSGKWMVIGGSYAGALSAFYRQRFPDLVVGSLSSSGPVQARENFEDYDLHVATVAGPSCAAKMREVTQAVEASLLDPISAAKMRKLFQGDVLLDDVDFLYSIADMGALAIQYGYRDIFCQLLEQGDPVQGYAQFVDQIYQSWGINALSGSAQGAISEDVNNYMGDIGMRQWFYQSCTQFGFWQNAYHDPAITVRSARINPAYHAGICQRLFGLSGAVPEQQSNQDFYAPLLDTSTSQILFTNGSRDPWSKLSISPINANDTNPNTSALVINGAAHCDDLRKPSASDLLSVQTARQTFADLVTNWLK